MLIIRSRTALLIGASALVLAACGGDDGGGGTGGGGELPQTTDGTQPAPGSPEQPAPGTGTQDDDAAGGDAAGGDAAGGDAAGLPPRPQPGSCVDIPVPDDGVYTVYDAGTAVVRFEDGRLVLGEVRAAEGWTARVDDEEPDEVEIDFRRSADEVLDLEVEIDDGRVEAEICNDDD
ncbi:hypothetical protein [Trujillonella humicola]|uniref:hypothetical protein n=1 Tax=Trujillonella humicola TaxID=3383699 RepID=UPI003906C6A0